MGSRVWVLLFSRSPLSQASAGPLDPMQLLEQEAEEKIRWR